MSSVSKIKEAAFFVELLQALEQRSDSLTHQGTASEEASYLFAAILNAFHACIDLLADSHQIDRGKAGAIQAFRAHYPSIYLASMEECAKTVRRAHVVPAGGKYVPPPGNRVSLVARRSPKLSASKTGRRSTDLRSLDEYQIFLQADNDLLRAVDFFETHLVQLRGLHQDVTGA